MNRSAVVTFFAIGALVAACGGTAAPTQTPAGGTPAGATATTPSGTAAGTPQATAPPVGGGTECAPYASLNPASYALPSFSPDPQIEAVFPAQIDGQPVTNVQSGSWLESICFYGGQADVDQIKARAGGSLILSNLSYGSADATVGGQDVTLEAFRIAGADGNAIIQNLSVLVAGITGQTPQPYTTSQTTIGGKPVWVITDSEERVSYAYVKGDTVVSVTDVSPQDAATIIAALP
jgi:hypothetical protein